MEEVNYLLGFKNMHIIQRTDMFTFSLDTVLLANFCSITKDVKEIVDFGTNNAAIPLLLSRRTKKHITGVEIQEEAVEVALKSVAINKLENQISIVHADIKDYALEHKSSVKMIVCNPPFFRVDEESNVNDNAYLRIARHEIAIDLEGIIKAASQMLSYGGKFAMVHRPDRMIEILELMKKYDLEPKRIRFVYPKPHKDANVFLIEAVYKGNTGLKIEQPLYAHNEDGSYTEEVMKYLGDEDD